MAAHCQRDGTSGSIGHDARAAYAAAIGVTSDAIRLRKSRFTRCESSGQLVQFAWRLKSVLLAVRPSRIAALGCYGDQSKSFRRTPLNMPQQGERGREPFSR